MDGGEYSGIGVGHEAAETDVIQYVLGPASGVDGVVVDRSAWYVLLSEHGRNGVVAVAGAGEEEKYVYVTRGGCVGWAPWIDAVVECDVGRGDDAAGVV